MLNEQYKDMWQYIEVQMSDCPLKDDLLRFKKDVAQYETTIAEVTKLAKEPIVNRANDEHDDALLRLVRIIEVLEEGD